MKIRISRAAEVSRSSHNSTNASRSSFANRKTNVIECNRAHHQQYCDHWPQQQVDYRVQNILKLNHRVVVRLRKNPAAIIIAASKAMIHASQDDVRSSPVAERGVSSLMLCGGFSCASIDALPRAASRAASYTSRASGDTRSAIQSNIG